MAMTKNEKAVWAILQDFYKDDNFFFGTRKPVSLKNTKANQKVIRDLSKWASPGDTALEERERKEFVDDLLTDHDGEIKIREDLLWDYLMEKQC